MLEKIDPNRASKRAFRGVAASSQRDQSEMLSILIEEHWKDRFLRLDLSKNRNKPDLSCSKANSLSRKSDQNDPNDDLDQEDQDLDQFVDPDPLTDYSSGGICDHEADDPFDISRLRFRSLLESTSLERLYPKIAKSIDTGVLGYQASFYVSGSLSFLPPPPPPPQICDESALDFKLKRSPLSINAFRSMNIA